jgi:dienelactone hydrolase
MDMRRKLKRKLGGWRVRFGPQQIVGESAIGGGTLLDLRFPGSHGETVAASFAKPVGSVPRPGLLWAHAHGNARDIGRRELTEGRPELVGPPLPDLMRLGVPVLCLEMPTFGDRQLPAEPARAKALLWQGRTLFGQMLAELAAGLDWLAEQPEVDAGRLGIAGISMGGTQAFWMAALDPRIAAAVHMCAFSDLDTLVASGAYDGHGIYMTVPGLLPTISTGRLAGMGAPRAQLACVGLADPFTPRDAFELARSDLEAAYAGAGPLAFHVEPDTGHVETPAMRDAWLGFLADHLVG